ncbi:hypothetical protein [Hymenobacter sp. BRD67]|uniref:hypothetical protein n=1 Tax=Hymenobacter sp. BRD67 TaxID=2675877 RepID=UPI00156777E9|nr:hypothetical protein [Hymenobacter sp. BRD67]QKG51418.1 hypothetical protein GKZ67_00980 [Hymenobacter sp. BRD67]
MRAPRYCVGWQGARVPARAVAAADSAEATRRHPPAPLVLARWRGLRIAFVSGSLRRLSGPAPAQPADVVVLRRNPYLHPEALAAHFGKQARVVFDSSCKRWYIARQDSALRAAGFRTWDVNEQGPLPMRCHPGGSRLSLAAATRLVSHGRACCRKRRIAVSECRICSEFLAVTQPLPPISRVCEIVCRTGRLI